MVEIDVPMSASRVPTATPVRSVDGSWLDETGEEALLVDDATLGFEDVVQVRIPGRGGR